MLCYTILFYTYTILYYDMMYHDILALGRASAKGGREAARPRRAAERRDATREEDNPKCIISDNYRVYNILLLQPCFVQGGLVGTHGIWLLQPCSVQGGLGTTNYSPPATTAGGRRAGRRPPKAVRRALPRLERHRRPPLAPGVGSRRVFASNANDNTDNDDDLSYWLE